MTNKEALGWLLTLEESEGEDVPIYDTDVEAVKIARKAIKQIDGVLEVLERYKLRIPPTVYYELVADIMNMEEEE